MDINKAVQKSQRLMETIKIEELGSPTLKEMVEYLGGTDDEMCSAQTLLSTVVITKAIEMDILGAGEYMSKLFDLGLLIGMSYGYKKGKESK